MKELLQWMRVVAAAVAIIFVVWALVILSFVVF